MARINWDESIELDKLAELSIRTGVALQPGQDLLITAPIEAAPLIRRLAYHAYKAGAGIVTPFYTDPEVILARYQNAPKASFERRQIGCSKAWPSLLTTILPVWL